MADPKARESELTGKLPEEQEDYSDPTCPCEAEPYWRALDDKTRVDVLDADTSDPEPEGGVC